MDRVAEYKGDVLIKGKAQVLGGFDPPIPRASLAQDNLAEYADDPTGWRVHDAFATNLPGTPADDDLGLVTGTLGTAPPEVQTGDLKAAGATTRYARRVVTIPQEYQAGQTFQLRFRAGMKATVADVSATLDIEAYKLDGAGGVSGDLYAGPAQDINSLTLQDIDFTITPTTLTPGDQLDVRIAMAVNDAATGTAVTGVIHKLSRLCDVKG